MHVNEQLLKYADNKLFSYKILESKKGNTPSRLRKISDEELLQECKARKLI